MSQGKRAPDGICDYCMRDLAQFTLDDNSEMCTSCQLAHRKPFEFKQYASPCNSQFKAHHAAALAHLAALGVGIGDMTSRPRKPQYTTESKYAPCKCGSGKKFKFCCMNRTTEGTP